MFCLSLLVVPSSRHDVVGDGPRAVPCDPVDFAFHLYLFFVFRLCLLPLFLSCLSYNPAYPDELVWTSTSCTPFLIAFASVFHYHIIIIEKILDTVFLIAYN